MFEIHIPDDQPEVKVSNELLTSLAVFKFDTERYVAGLALAEVPQPAIDTLLVEFDASGRGNVAMYDSHDHQLNVGVGAPDYNPDHRRPWNMERTTSAEVNYVLAANAKRISDTILKDPDIISYNKAYPPERDVNRAHAFAGVMFLGSVAGTGVAEAMATRPVTGTFIGAGLAVIAGLGIQLGMDLRPEKRQMYEDARRSLKRISERALEFANSTEARDIFSGVVEIELL